MTGRHTKLEHEPAHRLGYLVGAIRNALVDLAEGQKQGAMHTLLVALEREEGISQDIRAQLDEYDRKHREAQP